MKGRLSPGNSSLMELNGTKKKKKTVSKIDNSTTNKDLLHSTGNSAQCHAAAWMGGEFGEEWIQVYVQLSHFTVHLKLAKHC